MDTKQYECLKKLETVNDIFDIKDRVGIIIGGAGILGKQFASVLGLAGAIVIIADFNSDNCDAAVAEAIKHGVQNVSGMVCDVMDEENINRVFEAVYSKYGQIDFMIYNVMAKPENYYKSNENYLTETFNSVFQGNVTGAYLCCRKAASYMKKNGGGSIVLTASIYGVVAPDQRIYEACSIGNNNYDASDPLNCPASYSASKSAVVGLSKHLASLWGDDGIRVNVLTPGGVYDNQEKSFHDAYTRRTIIGRMAVDSDFNGAVIFLVSDASRYMTGANLIIDGGWTAW